MSNSPLVNLTRLSPHRNAPRNQRITKITPHHTAGNIGLEALGDWLSRPTTQASYNYGISSDGRVGMFVEERNRSWASSSGANDHQAVTIGVANSGGAPGWPVSQQAWDRLVALCVDICRRNPGITQRDGRPGLWFDGTPNASLTFHDMFTRTTCPGPFLRDRAQQLCDEVNAQLAPAPPSPQPEPQPRSVTLDILGTVQDIPGFNENGRNYVQLRAICEALGFRAEWDEIRRLPYITRASESSGPCIDTVDESLLLSCQDDIRLLREIVHWEARGEDIKGQILVANVVFNRMASPSHQNTLSEVIFHPGAFTPVSRADFGTATPNARTIEAVNRALAGEDFSQGATFFHSISRLTPEVWHERAVRNGTLVHLFDHGNHRFYKEAPR